MPAAARTLGEPDRRPKTRDASAFWHLIMFTRSFAIIDVEGRLVDWDAGFALEFSSVATSIARGLEWAVLIAAARDREGFTRGRPRDESENQNAAYDYRAHDQLIHIVEARLAGGGWCRIAHDVTRERDGDALGRQQEKKTQQFQKDKAVGRLTSGIAHDFNNLLMVALSNAESIIGHRSRFTHGQICGRDQTRRRPRYYIDSAIAGVHAPPTADAPLDRRRETVR